MCGIAGIWNYRSAEPVARDLIDQMTDSMVHRGPDDRGVYHDPSRGFAMGFRRLAIQDLSTDGHQPMTNEDGTLWLVFNGEIYNFQDLRHALQAKGHRFRSHTDSEVILHLYEEDGPDCVVKMNGMFAAAIWDIPRCRLMLMRDRAGKKPLYYYDDGHRMGFASELRALAMDPTLPRDVDPASLTEYLRMGYIGAPRTIFRDVSKLKPGHILLAQHGVTTLRRYWNWLDAFHPEEGATEDEWIDRVRTTFREAVRRRLVSDVPLGAFLSGGVDSSAVVAMMAGLMGQPVKTFSIGFKDSAFSELPAAREVATRFGTHHQEVVVEPESIEEVLPRLATHFDEPFGDSSALPTYYVCRAARSAATVCLSGDGGDETVGGYWHYRGATTPAPDASTRAGLCRDIASSAASVLPPFIKGYRRAARAAGTVAEQHLLQMSYAYPREVECVLAPSLRVASRHSPLTSELLASAVPSTLGALSRMQYVDFCTYLPDDILTKVDRMSMMLSLEVRCPFLDHDFLALFASIPDTLRVHSTELKYLFRRSMRGIVPDAILDRPKQGFSIPLGSWLGGDSLAFAREVLLDPRAIGRGLLDPAVVRRLVRPQRWHESSRWHLVWSLLVLELWCRHAMDGSAGASRYRPST